MHVYITKHIRNDCAEEQSDKDSPHDKIETGAAIFGSRGTHNARVRGIDMQFPSEVIYVILSHSDGLSMVRASSMCKTWNIVLKEHPELWALALRRDFQLAPEQITVLTQGMVEYGYKAPTSVPEFELRQIYELHWSAFRSVLTGRLDSRRRYVQFTPY